VEIVVVGEGEMKKVAVGSGRIVVTEAVESGNAGNAAAALGTGTHEVITSMKMLKKINRFITNIFFWFAVIATPKG
jgi:hypothetical protein